MNEFRDVVGRFRLETESPATYSTLLVQMVSERSSGSDVTTRVERGISTASSLHRTQIRADSSPYIVHPLRVACLCVASLEAPYDDLAVVSIAALLHDVLEDSDVDERWLKEEFGEEVFRIVDCLTAERPATHESTFERKARKEAKWSAVKAADDMTQLVHAGDTTDNAISWRFLSAEMRGWDKLPRWVFQAREYQLPLLTRSWPSFAHVLREEIAFEEGRGVVDGSWADA